MNQQEYNKRREVYDLTMKVLDELKALEKKGIDPWASVFKSANCLSSLCKDLTQMVESDELIFDQMIPVMEFILNYQMKLIEDFKNEQMRNLPR